MTDLAAVLEYEARLGWSARPVQRARDARQLFGLSPVAYSATLQRAIDEPAMLARFPMTTARLRRLRARRRRLRESPRPLPREDHMAQPPVSIDQPTLAGLLRDAGMAQASVHAAPDWKAAVDDAIVALAATGESFTAEDVRALVGDPPGHPNAMGARFNYAARRRVIRSLGYVKAERATLHRHPIQVWIGVEPAAAAS